MTAGDGLAANRSGRPETLQLSDILRLAEQGLRPEDLDQRLMRLAGDPLAVGRILRESESAMPGDAGHIILPGAGLSAAARKAVDAARAARSPGPAAANAHAAYHPVREGPAISSVAERYQPRAEDIGNAIDGLCPVPGRIAGGAGNGSTALRRVALLVSGLVLSAMAVVLLWCVPG